MGGTDIAKDGVCVAIACGPLVSVACPEGFWCDFSDDHCGDGVGVGICQPNPVGCPDIEDPVCGCDDKRYGNACDANAAGTDVRAGGTCQ